MLRRASNGLCGAAVPGMMMFTTGLHSGGVGFTVDVVDHAPTLADTWEEIVEVSFTIKDGDNPTLYDFDGPNTHSLAIPPETYRARFSARGMAAGAAADTLVDEDPVDFYSLVFWPAPKGADAMLKQTSPQAEYWHGAYGG